MNGDFTPECARVIASAFLETPPISVTPIFGRGSVNAIFHAKAAGREIIVRLQRGDDAPTEYRKERWCGEKARAAGVPTPEVLEIGVAGDAAYMIQEFVLGVNGTEIRSDSPAIPEALGKYARITHALPVSGFGNVLADADTGRFVGSGGSTWNDWVGNNITALRADDSLRTLGVHSEAESESIKTIFTALRDRDFHFGLCHGDLSARNVLVRPDGAIILLDWGCAEVHITPHYDLRELLRENAPDSGFVTAFRRGYALSDAAFATIRQEMLWLELLKSFDLVRWAIDRNSAELARYTASAKAALSAALLSLS